MMINMTRFITLSITIIALMLGATGLHAATLQSIAVTPANPSIAKGRTQQFTATGTFSDNSTQDHTRR
jgi:ABC-type proline/glycine betaine transport system permease subunit